VVYVQPEADDAHVDDGQGDSAGRDVGGARGNAEANEATVAMTVTEAVVTNVAEASREPKILDQMEV
jgi:hypothetical protein